MASDGSQWKIVESSYAVNDRWLTVRVDTLLSPEGKMISPWYVLEYPEWVNCVVIDKEDNVILLSHYRHGINATVTEIIGGVADTSNTSPLETIKRELHEEVGLDGGEVHQTGVLYANPSNQNNKVYTFLALGGMITGEQHEELGADFKITKIHFREFYEMCTVPQKEQTFQGLHIASVFYALNFIRYTTNPSSQILRLRSLM